MKDVTIMAYITYAAIFTLSAMAPDTMVTLVAAPEQPKTGDRGGCGGQKLSLIHI